MRENSVFFHTISGLTFSCAYPDSLISFQLTDSGDFYQPQNPLEPEKVHLIIMLLSSQQYNIVYYLMNFFYDDRTRQTTSFSF